MLVNIKRMETLTHFKIRINLVDIMVMNISHSLKDNYCIIPLRQSLEYQITETKSRMAVFWCWQERGMGSSCLMTSFCLAREKKFCGW